MTTLNQLLISEIIKFIWENLWQDQGTESEGGVEAVADRPGDAMFETDPLLRWLSCHFASLCVSSLYALQDPGAATTRGWGHVLEVSVRCPGPSLTSPPITTAPSFLDDREKTSVILWWVQWPSLLLSFLSLSLSLHLSVALPIFPSVKK